MYSSEALTSLGKEMYGVVQLNLLQEIAETLYLKENPATNGELQNWIQGGEIQAATSNKLECLQVT